MAVTAALAVNDGVRGRHFEPELAANPMVLVERDTGVKCSPERTKLTVTKRNVPHQWGGRRCHMRYCGEGVLDLLGSQMRFR